MTPEQRSRCMAAVRGRDTKPEMIVRKYLFSKGLRYRLHDKKLTGSPDIVLKKYKTVIFIDGCFWHGHEKCKYFKMPKSNVFFWENKIKRNKARDVANEFVLQTEGWKVIRVWECDISKVATRQEALENLYHQIVTPSRKSYLTLEPDISIAAESETDYTGHQPTNQAENSLEADTNVKSD